jgi:glycosyltransferase involved in cell wall biosynthesis
LQVSAYDAMGEQFNGLVLHRQLRARGHDSRMLVFDKLGDDPQVEEIAGDRLSWVNRYAQVLEEQLSLQSVLDLAGRGLYAKEAYRQAELVHLQLLHARRFFSLLQLPRITREKPVVWTIHDPWLTTGHCVHPLACERWMHGCGECPDLGSDFFALKRDRSHLNWKIKKYALGRSRLSLVFASKWMQRRAQASPILSHLPSEVIPFGLDPSQFNPGDKQAARAELGIPGDADVICFRAVDLPGAYKGTRYVEEALSAFEPRRPTWLLTFEQIGGLQSVRHKYGFVELGYVADRNRLARALRAADLFLMPSIAESFGMMAVEAMASAVPVICFDQTALPDVIGAPECGIAVPYLDAAALHEAIAGLLNNAERRRLLGQNALRLASHEYTIDRYVERHLVLYERLVQESGNRMAR